MTDRELLELAELKRQLRYEPETGKFFWLVRNSNRQMIGDEAGPKNRNSHGYQTINVGGVAYKAHRLAWFYITGEWPDQIDHINGVRDDNRIENLRNVTGQQNTHNQRTAHVNSSTGVLGVIAKPSGKFAAEIRVNGKKKHIGTFPSISLAKAAYDEAKLKFHEGALP
jgi:hypothetical protein